VYYTQVLRIACGLKWLAIVLAALYVLIVSIAAANGAFTHSLHGSPDNSDIPLPALFGIAGFAAAIFASRYARTLSEENEAHLPIVWTKPVSRIRYALTVVGVDVAGIVAAFAMTLLVALAFIATFGATRFIDAPADSAMQLLRFLMLPLGYYGVMTALTASFGKTGRGLIGWAWCVSLVSLVLASSDFPRPWSAIIAAVNVVNPLAYASYSHTSGHDTTNIASGPHGTAFTSLALSLDASALLLLFAAGIAAGIAQWRRLEA
jgi:hypothetical protein